jgi:hypothetical protein
VNEPPPIITDEAIRALTEITARILTDEEAAATEYLRPVTPRPTSPQGHDAYRRGLCSRCLTAPHAPGRTM